MIHGSRATYMNHSCRCEPCRDANRRYNRMYRDTEFGRRKSRLNNRKQDRRNRLAAAYVRDNLPEVWASIYLEAEKLPEKRASE